MKIISILITTVIIPSVTFAQSESFDNPIFKDTIVNTKRPSIRPSGGDEEVRLFKTEDYPAKVLAKDYEGFRIEIIVTDSLLPDSSDIFFRHGNVVMETLKEKQFAYSIGDFKEEQVANDFMIQFVLPRYSKSRIVKYSKGARVE